MDPTQQALWTRLQAYSFDDDPEASLPFRARLARENRWSLAFAGRAVEEYRRFAFLAVVAGHPVTPSDQVDQVWHLHLLYTRAYWEEFCPRVLGQTLHHGPTRGGAAEGRKFDDWYACTRESYRRFFDAAPPADLWPDAALRFGRDVHFARINTRGNWVIPKPPAPVGWLRRALGFLLAAGSSVFFAGNASGRLVLRGNAAAGSDATGWNPLNFYGPQFLGFYLLLLVLAMVVAVVWRYVSWRTLSRQAERDTPASGGPDPVLDTSETAYLAGGEKRAVEAAVVALLQRNLLKLEADGSVAPAATVTAPPDGVTDLEQAILQAAGQQHKVHRLAREPAIPTALARVNRRLESLGLTLDEAKRQQAGRTLKYVLAAPLLLGAAKILVGIARGRPVAFLVVLCVVNVLAALLFPEPGQASARGIALLARLRQRYGGPRPSAPGAADAGVGDMSGVGTALALGVGLYGASALACDDALAPLHRALYPPSSSSDGGGSDSGGGCGGGGCGGCGGGGGGD